MKKFNILIAILAGFLVFTGCEDLDQEPVLDITTAAGPALASPSDGGTYVLLQDEVDNDFATFTWSVAEYGFQASINYILEMDLADNAFADPVTVGTTADTSMTMTVGEFNEMLLKNGFETDVAHNIAFRVKSDINSNVDELVSPALTLSITPFADKAPPLYMLGDGTRAGWNNAAALEMQSLGNGVYEIVDSLLGDGKFVKFITTLGQWAPQYGSDGSGTWEAGTLVLRPTESDPDPAPLDAPPAPGVYKITVDIINLTYTIEEYGLYILGDATLAGWDNENPLPMDCIAPYTFSITTELAADLYYKFITNPGNWAPQYGTDDSGTEDGGNLVLRPTEGDPDPPAIQNLSAGTKTIECDLINLTYTVTAAK